MKQARPRIIKETQLQQKLQMNKKMQKEDGMGKLGLPRKIVKKSEEFETILVDMEYSNIPNVPEIKLNLEQMRSDPIGLLLQMEKRYEQFGAVKIITPPQWKSPFCFNYGQISIDTRVQHIHKLKAGKAFKENESAYNVKNFYNMAQKFEKEYRFKTFPSGSNKLQNQQSEYWNIVNGEPQGKYKVSVQYAADLPVSKHGSGFPLRASQKSKDDNFDYLNSLFNLNNLYKSKLSILSIADTKKQFISGVTTPWVYMGMMFSTFCWHVEDLWLNSINYNHRGSTKTWYVIPRKYKEKFDKFVAKKTGKQDLLDRITFMIDPLEIIRNGIPVFKANQNPGEYVCTFFKAYHAGFSHGFNVGEAVNFVSPISLAYIKQAMNFLAENKQKRPAVLSYDWLVYQNKLNYKGNGDAALQKIINQQYLKALKNEQEWIKKIADKYKIKGGQQIQAICKYDRNSCSKCRNYLYLSSFRCVDCKKNYCAQDFQQCCNGTYDLVYRELNNDRKWINAIIGRNK